MTASQPFTLDRTYVYLSDDVAAVPIDVGADFWATLGDRKELQGGRLVVVTHEARDWSSWEMHPAGDEVVCLLSGAVDLILQEKASDRVVALRGRQAVIVPQGTWHRAVVREAGDMLFITRGTGTQHKPL
jgi:mannose-6-phosphate isomerase-like protein (cupin superfamily)